MALAETARLLAQYDFKDNSKAGIASATRGVGTLQGKLGGLSGSLSKAGGALRTFGGRINQLAGVGLGILGIGGLFSLGKLFNDSIAKAREFGDASIRLSQLVQLPIEATSRMIDALDFFGITAEQQTVIAGKFEKALGTLAEQSAKGVQKVRDWNKTHDKAITPAQRLALLYPKLAKFQKDYGLKVTDTKGKLLDYNQQLLASADFFNNKNIPAQKKAAALQKLYGKGWQDLIPILAQGRAGILKAERDAMHLSQADLDAITKNKQATREWQDAVGDLETQIGIKLLPTLTDVLTGASSFVNAHSDEIIQFVKDAVEVGKGAVNTIVGVAEELGGLWNKIPQPLRDFISGPLLKLAVGEKVIKFLFGVSPAEIALKGAETALKNILGGGEKGLGEALVKAGLGKAFVQPVFVTNQGFGPSVPGVPAAGTAAGGLGLVAGGLALIGVAGIELLIADAIGKGLRTAVQGDEGPLRENHVIAEIGPAQFGVFQSLKQEMEANRKASEATATNTSGSPDDRDDAARAAAQKKAVDDARDAIETQRIALATKLGSIGTTLTDIKTHGLTWKPSKDVQIEDRRPDALGIDQTSERHLLAQAQSADLQRRVTEEARDKIEANRIALVSLKQTTSTKVGDLQRTTSTGDNQIVDAIDRLSIPVPAVYVTVKDGSVTSSAGFVSGGRTGGGARRG